MSHIFISYSRRDLDFAQKIVDALAAQDLETWIDWKSIPKGEDWEQEIYRGIEGADAFLFLLSPASITSVMCNKELVHAIRNNKRILPILLQEVNTSDFLDETARNEIKRRNWIFCRKGRDDFAQAIQIARETIRTDYDWLRFHTTLQTRALGWERAGKDASRLLRGKELKEAEKQTAGRGPGTEPFLTHVQRQFMTKSRQSARRRQAMPYSVISLLAAVVFVGGKYFYGVIPIPNACPEVGAVSYQFEGSELPGDTYQTLLAASENTLSETSLGNCNASPEEIVHATAGYDPETGLIELAVGLPETPAYRLDLLQEIREFGPELVVEEEAVMLLHAFSAYSVGEYQVAIDLLEGQDSLSALTLLAQARLFTDDLQGSREAYDLALRKPQPSETYRGKLNMGAGLALWRPESYYVFSLEDRKEDCQEAAPYYARALEFLNTDSLAHNIKLIYAEYCFTDDDSDPGNQPYAAWREEMPKSEPDLTAKDAAQINATAQYILAFREGFEDEAARDVYKNGMTSAQALLLARAALSEFYWEVEENCSEARTWREAFQSGIVSNIEKEKLRRLLQAEPLFCS